MYYINYKIINKKIYTKILTFKRKHQYNQKHAYNQEPKIKKIY